MRTRRLAVVLIATILSACGGGSGFGEPRAGPNAGGAPATASPPFAPTPPPTAASVRVDAAVSQATPGWNIHASAEAFDESGRSLLYEEFPWEWSISDPQRASLQPSANGLAVVRVHALSEGRVTVTAKVHGLTASTEIDIRTDAGHSIAGLAAGSRHTCASVLAGPPLCRGANEQGQLGDRMKVSRPIPAAIAGLSMTSAWRQHDRAAVGADFSCVLLGSRIDSWGGNESGQLGDGSMDSRTTAASEVKFPEPAFGGYLAAGPGFVCSVMEVALGPYDSQSRLLCWGNNASGQLGVDVGPLSPVPMASQVPNAGGIAVAAGSRHACAILWSGVRQSTLYCWGANESGQLGDGTMTNRWTPVPVFGLGATVLGVAAGQRHSCALDSGYQALCWGDNSQGQLGSGALRTSLLPVAVDGDRKLHSISAGDAHTCAVDADGAAYCWGANDNGQLGNDSTVDSPVPVAVRGGLSFESLVAGAYHTCGLTRSGLAYCWGANTDGQLGDGTTVHRLLPVKVLYQAPRATTST